MSTQDLKLFDLLDGLEMTKSQYEWLARRFENMTAKEALLFRGAMQIEQPQATCDVMQIANQLEHYELLYGAGNDFALGNFVMEHIFYPSSQTREFLDPAKVGAAYRQKDGNTFCDGNFIRLSSPLDLSQNSDPAMLPDRGDYGIRVKLASRNNMEGIWVGFPDTSEYMDSSHPDELLLALDALDAETLTECIAVDVDCCLPQLRDILSQYDSAAELIRHAIDFGYVWAEQGQGEPRWLDKWQAVMELEDCHQLDYALDLAQNLHCYNFMPRDMEVAEYGRLLAKQDGVYPNDALLAECFDAEGYVFEAPIDLLAFLTLYPEDWQQHSYVALCGTAEHAMLWMLEQNPKLQKIILCLDHDAAGIEAAGRLTDILCKHGYTQSAPLRSTNKDWDEDLKEQHGLEPQPPEEHPQLIVAGTICERIGAKCKAVRPEQASYQIPRLLQQYQNDLHWGRFEQAMDHMETMSALALSVVLRECRQMGTVLTEEQGARFLQSHIHPHQNRGSLKTRATEIGMEFQSVLAKDAVEGIRTEVEKKATASAWLELAISCAKVPIKYCADELRRQQKEEKALLEAAQAMASY